MSPLRPSTRWHGTTNDIGFLPTAAPTAAAPVDLSAMAGMHHAPADAEAAWAARPAFTGVDPETEAAYEYALFHPEAIAWMPCYCGCAAIDHRSNLDCYLARETANGKTQFEEHASFCEICVRTTLLTQRLLGGMAGRNGCFRISSGDRTRSYTGSPFSERPLSRSGAWRCFAANRGRRGSRAVRGERSRQIDADQNPVRRHRPGRW